MRLAADVGGTFTDVAVFDEHTGELRLGKTLTTPERLVDGIGHGVNKAALTFSQAGLFLHGTTTIINTILERSGAKTGLLRLAEAQLADRMKRRYHYRLALAGASAKRPTDV